MQVIILMRTAIMMAFLSSYFTVAVAAAPEGLAFSDWTVADGVVSADCPVGYDCAVSVESQGMYQDVITSESDPDARFVRTILTDKDSTGTAGSASVNFSGESFISAGLSSGSAEVNNGIASLSFLNGNNAEDVSWDVAPETLSSRVEISTGWAGETFEIYQELKDGWDWDGDGKIDDGMVSSFSLEQTGVGGQDGKQMGILQDITAMFSVEQKMAVIEKTGVYSTGTAGIVDLNEGTGILNLNAGDSVRATWIGQDMLNIMGQGFGRTLYENNTLDASVSLGSVKVNGGALDSVTPEQWDETFWVPPGVDEYDPKF